MDIGPTASMTGTADYINFYFHVCLFFLRYTTIYITINLLIIVQFLQSTIDILSGIVVVDVFDLKKIGHISTDIKGLGIFNWLAEIVN